MAATTITIRLRNRLVKIHASRRHRMAISYLRDTVARQFKSSPGSIKISRKLNEYMEATSTNRYRPVKITVNKIGDLVEVALPEEQKVEKTAAAPAKAAAQTAPGTASLATTKAAAVVQKEVANEIGKKVEEKKGETKSLPPKEVQQKKQAIPKKEQAENPTGSQGKEAAK